MKTSLNYNQNVAQHLGNNQDQHVGVIKGLLEFGLANLHIIAGVTVAILGLVAMIVFVAMYVRADAQALPDPPSDEPPSIPTDESKDSDESSATSLGSYWPIILGSVMTLVVVCIFALFIYLKVLWSFLEASQDSKFFKDFDAHLAGIKTSSEDSSLEHTGGPA